MSLIDFDDPAALERYAQAQRRHNPACVLSSDHYCQTCEQPHEWCECKEMAK